MCGRIVKADTCFLDWQEQKEKHTNSYQGNWILSCKRMTLHPYLRPNTKKKKKWIKGQNASSKAINHLEGKAMLCGIESGYDFLELTSKALAIKGKQAKWTSWKLENIFTSKGTTPSKRITYATGENIRESCTNIQTTLRVHKTQNNDESAQRQIDLSPKTIGKCPIHTERHWTWLVCREKQIKPPSIRLLFTLIRLHTIKTKHRKQVQTRVWKNQTCCTFLMEPVWKISLVASQTKSNFELSCSVVSPFLDMYQK